MAIGISLVNFTDQGIKNIKDSPRRAGTDEALAALLLSVGRLGNVRSQTLHAMEQETFQRVLAKVD